MEYTLLCGKQEKTKAMKAGRRSLHEALEEEVIKKVKVRVDSAEDVWAFMLLNFIVGANQLLFDGLTRELPLAYKHLWDSLVADNFPSGQFFEFFSLNPNHILSAQVRESTADVKSPESTILQVIPSIRSGSFADTGPCRFMEDEHIRIDDLSAHLGSLMKFPKPSAFYGVTASYLHVLFALCIFKGRACLTFSFIDTNFPETSEVDAFLGGVESSLRKGFLLSDLALAKDCNISSSSGTTALTALVLGSKMVMVYSHAQLVVLNCPTTQVHVETAEQYFAVTERQLTCLKTRLNYPSERRRVEGGFIDDGYLNVTLVRQGLRRHDDPEQCANDLVIEALWLNTFDNLTVIIVCFTSPDHQELSPMRQRRLRSCSFSAEALYSLQSWLDNKGSH
ncbi:hypothetical protein KY290_001794 [Solanum tuberosum]|uniref:Uncharacterized protein n=1 Tax=Solanum tuberosum TaxID=4113 RepID=A0ABQ7WN71_SOLTU|nr:hypothetical protein KY290_001794 [Solanum tuberosum]